MVISISIIGLMHTIGRMDSFKSILYIDFAFVMVIVGLTLYLNSKLFPPYSSVKEKYKNEKGDAKLRKKIQFYE